MAERLENLPSKAKIFIDSNILIYSLSRQSIYHEDCSHFVNRIVDGEVFGFLNPFVMSEVLFKNLIASLIKEYHPKDLIQFIKKNPHVLKKRKYIYEKISLLLGLNLNMLPTGRETWTKAVKLSVKYSLLPNDSIHAATCYIYNIEHIATNDSDFERVSFLKVWKPKETLEDLPSKASSETEST